MTTTMSVVVRPSPSSRPIQFLVVGVLAVSVLLPHSVRPSGSESDDGLASYRTQREAEGGGGGGKGEAGGGGAGDRTGMWDDSRHLHQSSATAGRPDAAIDVEPLSPNQNEREMIRKNRFLLIQEDILRKLRLSSLPNMTGRRLPALPHLQNIINKTCRQKDASCSEIESVPDRTHAGADNAAADDSDDGEDDYHSTTIRVMLFPNTSSDVAVNVPWFDVCQFWFQPDLSNSEVLRAYFSVYLRRPSTRHDRGVNDTFILGYRLQRDDRGRIIRQRLFSKKISLANDTGQWHMFSVMHAVRRWLIEPQTNLGLVVEVTDSQGEPLAIIEPRNADEEPYKPILELHVGGPRQQQRSKRTTDLDCDDLSAERHCCRYPLVVDFDTFGWDWVIVPRRYKAYYCSGECQFLYMQSHPLTHVRQQLQQQLQPGPGNGGPCCSPRRVSAISMLYYDEYMNIVYGRLPGMVVEQCGCV